MRTCVRVRVMNKMEKSSFHRIIAGVKRYLGLQREYVMLSLAEKLTVVLTALMVGCVLMVLALLVLFFASLAASSLISELTGSATIGYCAIALFYLFVCLFVYFNRKRWIANHIANFLAGILLEDENDADNTKA